MDRAQYNACMSPYIKGKEKTKEERQANFCIGAKICTGKAKNEEEAARICAEPKPPKPISTAKPRGNKCFASAAKVADCVISKLDAQQAITTRTIRDLIVKCQCGSLPKNLVGDKPISKNKRAQQMWDEMPPEQKEALQMMAVIGQEYGSDTLSTESKYPGAK